MEKVNGRPGPFPVAPPIDPMLAKLADELPPAGAFLFEPKWDGFRAIVFRGGAELYIQSRDLRPLDRYFPELHDAFLAKLPAGCVLDGEIVVARDRGLDFDALQMRLHPPASRVAKPLDLPYAPGKRALLKVKHVRVVARFRGYRGGRDAVGSLLLGLYDEHDALQHVGVTPSFTLA